MRPTPRTPTLRTIAAEAGLSITSVAKSLKDAPDIGEDTKRRVREIASRLGYVPNRSGANLRTGRTMNVALVLDPHNELVGYGTSMIHGLSRALRDTDYHLVITPNFLEDDPMVPVRSIIEARAADGIVVTRTEPEDERVRFLASIDFPVVTHGRTRLPVDHAWFDYDNDAFASAAARHLLSTGRNRITAVLPPDRFVFRDHIVAGLDRTLSGTGSHWTALPGTDLDGSFTEIRDAVRRLSRSADRPDGFVCPGDVSAAAVIAAYGELGLVPGRDYDVVAKCISDTIPSLYPAVTVFHEDIERAGFEMGRALLAVIDGAAPRTLQILDRPV